MTADLRVSFHTQYAALPYRPSPDGQLHVLLITSRDSGRWIIPKGWPMPGKTGPQVAAQEAFEEAGVIGKTGDVPVGSYRYLKRRRRTDSMTCLVEVFPLEVTDELERWPETRRRVRSWFTPQDAAARVDEAELKALIGMYGLAR
ncbi:NUDIX hydrolase [Vineibacter terrae]|uniref:NUDIX hydrolase n=1 Tax=Vineibacter terrae TaxID=2586908 RepID=UPI002E3383C1|nr:NUDIX hydrolase [Vineibacter terrae]HEX2887726.1 NUDIX hydrolase [Vineibacter terrae]